MIDTLVIKLTIQEKVINAVGSALKILCESRKEKDIQDILASRLNAKVRHPFTLSDFPEVEIDVFGKDYAIEVKYNERYYSGISQLMAQRVLCGINALFLLHLHRHPDSAFLNAFSKLAEELGFIGILINKRKEKMSVVP